MNHEAPTPSPTRARTRTRIVALAIVAALALVAAACGSDETESASDTAVAEDAATDTAAAESASTDTGDGAGSQAGADQPPADGAAPPDGGDAPPGDSGAVATGSGVVTGTIGNSDYLGDYQLTDEQFGTEVTVTVTDGVRTIVSNSLPNHETGEFPNSGNPNEITEQSLVHEFPSEPLYTGQAVTAQTPGVAISGVTFEPGTAETVTCDSGDVYRIEALQDLYNLGLDFNNAHVQPGGQYHYHGVSELLVNAFEDDADLVHIGFAADGHLMYYSKSGAYQSGYELSTETRTGSGCVASGPAGGDPTDIDGTTPDGTYVSDWVHIDGGDLDACNGTEIDGEYVYFLTDEYPFIPRCMMGEFTATGPGGGAPPGGGGGGEQGAAPGGAPPDLAAAAEVLGISERELQTALGTPPPDLAAAAETLGITEAELTQALGLG